MTLPARKNFATNPSFEYPAYASLARVNLCQNPSLNTDTAGWLFGGAWTPTTSTVQKFSGAASALMTRNTATAGNGFARYIFPVVAGKTYTMSVYTYGGTGAANSLSMKTTSNMTSAIVTWTPSAGWTRHSVTATASTTGNCNLYVTDDPNVAPTLNALLYIDAVLIEETGTLGAYFDGDTTDTSALIYAWAGTVGNSLSTCKPVPIIGGPSYMTAYVSTGGSAKAYMDTDWAAGTTTGIASVRVDASGASSSATSCYPYNLGSAQIRMGLVNGKTYTASCTIRMTAAQVGSLDPVARCISIGIKDAGGATLYTHAVSAQAPNGAGVTRLSVTWTIPTDATECFIRLMNGENSVANGGGGGSVWWDELLIEETPAVLPYFDGNSALDLSGYHGVGTWLNTANASASTSPYLGIFVEPVVGSGMPRVNVYAAGLTGSPLCKITRQVGGDVWTVPGWRERSVTSADATVDWFVPYNVPVTYQLYVSGQAYNSYTITVPSTYGYVCDPLQPDGAMPIDTVNTSPATLALAKGSMRKFVYDPRPSYEVAAGSRYAVARAGQRSAGDNTSLQWYAHSNAVNDQLRALIADAPILLFKPLPTWVTPSSLLYLAAPVIEMPMDRDRGGQNTAWSVEGPLVASVIQPPISGAPTYDEVATNLGVRTYASIQSSSGYKRYVDIQANPLGLGA